MHPSLAPHLHGEECKEIIKQLHKCHEDNKYKKFFGTCNNVRRALDKCLQKEYNLKRTINKQKSIENEKRVAEKIERDSRPISN